MLNKILTLFKRKQKIQSSEVKAIIKVTDVGKNNNTTDDSNKIIELHEYGKITPIKYSDADVEALESRGIPVLYEDYTDEYKWIDTEGGGIEYFK